MTILPNHVAQIPFVAAMLLGCSSPASESTRGSVPIAADELPRPAVMDAAVGMSEVHARRELDAMFRAAGFRILNDEPIEQSHIEVVLDGYDPEQEVGYEYVDSSEAAMSLSAEQRQTLSASRRLFIIGSSDVETLRREASKFLASALEAPDGGLPAAP